MAVVYFLLICTQILRIQALRPYKSDMSVCTCIREKWENTHSGRSVYLFVIYQIIRQIIVFCISSFFNILNPHHFPFYFSVSLSVIFNLNFFFGGINIFWASYSKYNYSFVHYIKRQTAIFAVQVIKIPVFFLLICKWIWVYYFTLVSS